jgi:hypothetical protein
MMSHAARADLDALRRLLPGKVHGPGDPEWERLRLPWAVNIAQDPAAVVTVDAATDVSTVVRHARERGWSVSVQPVGHSATTHLDGTILLRTTNLSEIDVDSDLRIARVGAGVKWQAVLEECGKHALVPLSGSSGDPSVVGLALGGGLSWFARAHGSTADTIVAVELVDADGQFRRVTAASDPELFWAVRGGGGDFGIVTALELRLFPADRLWGGRLLWPIALAGDVLRAFVQVTAAAPDEFTAWAHLLRFPPLPEVPEPLRGGAFVSVDMTCLGTAADPEALLAPLRALPAPLLDTTDDVAIAELGAILAEPTDPMPDMHIGELLTDFDEGALARLLAVAGPDADSSLMIVQLRHLGGALSRPAGGSGACGTLEERFALMALGVPVSPETAAAIDAELTALRAALRPQLSGRVPFTFLNATDATGRAFPPDTLARLQEIKKSRDPRGVIRSNHPVLAAG